MSDNVRNSGNVKHNPVESLESQTNRKNPKKIKIRINKHLDN